MKKLLVVLVAFVMVLGLVGSAFAAKELKLSMTLTEGHPCYEMGLVYDKLLRDASKGELGVKVFGNSQLGTPNESFEGLQLGTIELGNINVGPIAQFVPSWEVFSLPFIFSSPEHMFAALDGDFGKAMVAELEKHDVIFLGWADSGSRNVITNKVVNSPADLKGQKIRVMDSKLMVDTLNAMGGIATPMGQAEVYSALQQGVIDGWENNPATLWVLKLYEVSKNFAWTHHFMAPDVLVLSKAYYDKLPPEQQKMVLETGKKAALEQRVIWKNYIGKTIENLKGVGVKFNDVSDLDGFKKSVEPVRAAYVAKHGTKYLDMIAAAAPKK